MARSMRVGGGARFASLKRKIASRGGYGKRVAGAIAAKIGRKKYGKRRFQKMASRGKRRARRRG